MSTAERLLSFFFSWQFLAYSLASVVLTNVYAIASGMYRKPTRGFHTGMICGIAFGLGALAAFNTM
jgi:hypothetical protein